MAAKHTRDIVYTDDHPILPVTVLRRLLGITIFVIILGLILVFLFGSVISAFQINLMGLGLAISAGVSAVAGLFIYDKTNKYERISRNKNSEVLAKKATSENINVLTMIAANSNTDSETLQKLSEHTDVDVLDYVIRNPNTSIATLKQLTERDLHWVTEHSLEYTRKNRIEQLISTLNENDQKIATLLTPTFTGWEDDLMQTIQTLNHGQPFLFE